MKTELAGATADFIGLRVATLAKGTITDCRITPVLARTTCALGHITRLFSFLFVGLTCVIGAFIDRAILDLRSRALIIPLLLAGFRLFADIRKAVRVDHAVLTRLVDAHSVVTIVIDSAFDAVIVDAHITATIVIIEAIDALSVVAEPIGAFVVVVRAGPTAAGFTSLAVAIGAALLGAFT